jgi:transaldolase
MATNPLRLLEARGQSVWQDNITRDQLTEGLLERLIVEDEVSGVTSNPTIFQKAIGGSVAYDAEIRRLARQGRQPAEIADVLMIEDVQGAADVLRPVWDRTGGEDGYVSIEVSPRLARGTQATIAEAHRLWEAVNRPNLLVKIPGTAEGILAIHQCLADGLNVNITLLFALARYDAVMDAYLAALEARLDRGDPIDRITSVASFFVSRVDTIVDRAITEKLSMTTADAARAKLASLQGTAAIANARLAYARFEQAFSQANPRWRKLTAAGARLQRPLWASTSMKAPARRDVLYVEELIAPYTVDTMPTQTITDFRDHGEVRGDTAKKHVEEAGATLQALREVGIDLDALTTQLEVEGIALFVGSHEALVEGVARKVTDLDAKQAPGRAG